MTTHQPNPRLRSFFNAVIHGNRPLGSQGRLLMEAICDQEDRPTCVNSIIASDKGLSSVQEAVRTDLSSASLNGPINTFLLYLQEPSLTTIGGGQFLAKIIHAIVDPPFFWSEFVEAFRQGRLQEQSQESFAWLLLQLVLLPGDQSSPYCKVAEDPLTLSMLTSLPSSIGRTYGEKIHRVVSTGSAATVKLDSGFAPGGRHDNDFVNFREISILPTAEEITSTDKPFLRPGSALDDPETFEQRVPMYLDNQFRLLREDMLNEMRDEVQVILGIKKGRKGGLFTLSGLSVADVYLGTDRKRSKWGLMLQCAGDIAQLKGQKDLAKRKSYLLDNPQGKKILKHQSLACLVIDGSIATFSTIHRDEDFLAKNPPVVIVHFSGQATVAQTLLKLKSAQEVKLIPINTAMFSYEPVLKALQNIKDLPLSQELLFWENTSLLRMVQHNERLATLTRKIQSKSHQDLRAFLGSSKPVILDKAQETSLLAGLTQTVSLIQGPPGTGKSFIGAILAKFFHDYTEDTILVVCYTNHALDQFLEDLLDIGIPIESIVRLGGKSSPRIEPMSLRNQTGGSKLLKADWKIIDDCKAAAETHTRSLKSALNRYRSNIQDADIMAHIEFEDYDYFEAFSVPTTDDGMVVIGKDGRAIDEYYLLAQWTSGQDAGSFNGHPQIARAKGIWEMNLAARQARILMWTSDILKYHVDELYQNGKLYDSCQLELQRKFEEKNVDILRSKRIIGCTTTGAAMYKESIQGASPDVLLVEEAGEILESHVVTALGTAAKQMVLIGDHKQLRPKVNHYALTVEKGDGYNLNMSLFERLVLKGYPHSTLVSQHRMRPEISALIRHLTYPDLTDASKTAGRPNLRGVRDNIIFITHTRPEDEDNQLADRRDMDSKTSKHNTYEVKMVLKIVRYLLQQGYKTSDLVVLTPYLGQLAKLRVALSEETDPVLNDTDRDELFRAGVMTGASTTQSKRSLKLVTIDNYQGEESDIVITSLCRSNSTNDIGFMSSPERLNVLLSRARNSLIMIGNADTFTHARKGKDLWKTLMQLLHGGGHVYDGFPVICTQHPERSATLKMPEDFGTECPDGGCNSPCGIQLSCGLHRCLLKCHSTTLVRHNDIRCQQITEDHCAHGHSQSRKCYQQQLPCAKCAKSAKQAEAQLRKDFELHQRREAQQAEHERRLNALQDQIDAEEENLKAVHLAQQQKQIIRQKQDDLKQKQNLVTSAISAASTFFTSNPMFSPLSASQTPPAAASPNPPFPSTTTVTNVTNNPPDPSSSQPAPQTIPPRSPTPPGNPATANVSSPEAEWQRQKDVEGASSAAIDTVMGMIGLEEVKRQMLRIKDKIEVTQRQGTSLNDERFNIVLLGNPGTGKTTVARQYAKFLTSQKIIPGHAFLETTGAKLAHEGVSSAQKLIDDALNAGGGAIFIDEAYQLTSSNKHGGISHQGGQVLDFFLAEMENRIGTIVFILAGYSKEMESFFEHNPGLPSRVPYDLKFTDYTDEELLRMLEQLIRKKYRGQMKVEGGVMGLYTKIAVRRLASGRGRPGFGNARALQTMFAKITERQAARISAARRSGLRPDDFMLLNEDIIGPDPSVAMTSSAAWRELQGLTGLKSVKESVQNLCDTISVNYRRELEELKPMQSPLNRVFLGSPGTGKTTVGKLYGQILADLGMLSNGEVVMKNPADFVGQYIGQSEAKTKAILASTVGKVLIIDEAYMLYGTGGGSNTDSFKTAVIDTIVAEVQSVPGEDRCVLLLGYESQMRNMFQNVNEGLSRRFAIDDAFMFDDFSNPELLEIMEGKLKRQDLSATEQAKQVAMELLSRERNRPNFGNGGAVENLLGQAKSRYMARFRGSRPPAATVFEPQDFDPDFDRHLHAAKSLDKLFEGIVGCEEVIDKLRDYQKISLVKKARGEDPRDVIPTNFVFKGPPGTGKTTIARKIGQVYYDMGFLASSKVEECSASDLVGQYVGHTGPKTQKLFEKALGQVLFIDEAYRLGDGRFAQEAVDEMVGLLTQEKFRSKIVVILAGYERDIDKLFAVNSGLSSRFSEVIPFQNFTPKACLEILDKKLTQSDISLIELRDPSSKGYLAMETLIEDLSGLPSWGNARDMETLAKKMNAFVLRQQPDSGKAIALTLNAKDAVEIMITMLKERRGRSNPPRASAYDDMLDELSSNTTAPAAPAAASQSSASAPPVQPTSQQQNTHVPPPTAPAQKSRTPRPAQPRPRPNPPPTNTALAQSTSASSSRPRNGVTQSNSPRQSNVQRDSGVSDAAWNQLQADRRAQEQARNALESQLRQAQQRMQQAIREEEKKRAAERAALAAEAAAKDMAARQEAQRKREQIQRQQQAAAVERQRLANEFKAKQAEKDRKKREEMKIQGNLRKMGVCVQGYQWIKQPHGYRCAGGAHFIGNSQLGIK